MPLVQREFIDNVLHLREPHASTRADQSREELYIKQPSGEKGLLKQCLHRG